MIRLASLLSSAALASLAAACGGGGGDVDANIQFFDASPDATLPPDAFVCVETATMKSCGPTAADCVNITTDEANCGGCEMPCNAGAGCVAGPSEGGSEVAHCECPGNFLPSDNIASIPPENVGAPISAMNPIPNQPGDWAGLGLFLGNDGTANGILASFGLGDGDAGTSATELDTDIDIATLTGNTPGVGLANNFDSTTYQPQGAYRATAGTIRYSKTCEAGAAGVVTDGVFQAVSDFTNPDAPPVEGGCQFTASFSFTVGAPNSCP
jgi:hypothetical protein